MKRTLLCLYFLLACLLIVGIGCGDDDDDDNDTADPESDDDDEVDDDDDDDDEPIEGFGFDNIEVEWLECSLFEGQNDGRAQCAATKMPFDWYDQDGRTFSTYAKRLLSSTKESEGQLWLLHGGPGASGVIGFPGLMEFLQELYPELDIYTIDPRGTGYSEYIECPDQEDPNSIAGTGITKSEMKGCVEYLEEEYGDDLKVFGATAASIDLAAYIHHTKAEGKKVLIWGASGGTFWAQRYLQNFPDQADGIILEGVEPANGSLVFQDEFADKVTAQVLQMCKDDVFCSAKIADPEATLLALYDKLNADHCDGLGMSETLLRQTLDYLAYYHPHHATIPALIYRLDRCNDDDRTAIVHFYDVVFGNGKGASSGGEKSIFDQYMSTILFYNEVTSEIWEHYSFAENDDLIAYLDTVYEDSLMGFGKAYDRNDVYLMWPRYDDPLDNQFAETDVPMLMLQGAIDPATPAFYAQDMTEHFNNANQHFALLPYSPHNVHDGSPYEGDPDDLHCALRLWIEFMKNPTGDLDMSCIDEALPLDFEGTDYANYFFGTVDYWENSAEEVKGSDSPIDSPRLELINMELSKKLQADFPEFLQWIQMQDNR